MKLHMFLLAIVIFNLAFLAGNAFGQTATNGDWIYTYSTNSLTATVTKFTGSSSTPSVPSSFSLRLNTGQKDENGDYIYKTYSFKVTALHRTFYGNQTITSVFLPSSVTDIGSSTFYNCSSLSASPLHSGIKTIGDSAFSMCSNLSALSFPASLTGIGNSAFLGCTGLTSVRTPETLKNLGPSAFRGCIGLTEATIDGDNLILPMSVLANCSNLVSVTIGDGVTDMSFSSSGGSAPPFSGDTKLQEVTVGTGITSISNWFCYGLPELKHVTMRGSMQHIGREAFCNCEKLETVSFGGTPEVIEGSAFSGCRNLTGNVNLSQCHSIGSYAFNGCSSWPFGELKIPKITTINSGTFSSCKGLTGVEFSPALTTIGNSAFLGCTGLISVRTPETLKNLGSSAFRGCLGLTEVTIDGDNLILPMSVLANCSNLVSVTIGDGVTDMNFSSSGGSAPPFSGDTKLQEVTVGTGITSISNWFCYGLPELKHVTMRGSMQHIGREAFCNCEKLETVSFGGTPEVIEGSAFMGCENLTGTLDLSQCRSIGSYAFYGCSTWQFGHVELPKIASLNNSTFYACKGLTEIHLAKELNSIGASAFQNCSSLSNVWFKGGVPTVETSPFVGVASGARGHYTADHAAEWLPQIGSDGKWQGLIMAEIPGPMLRVDSANPAEGSLTLAWDETATVEGVTYSVYRSANDTYSAEDLVTNGLTGTSWTDTTYWSAEPVLKPLNYWVVADGGGYGERASNRVETRRRFGVFVGVSDYDPVKFPEDEVARLPSCAAGATLFRDLAIQNGEVPATNAILLTTAEETKLASIRKAFQNMGAKMQPGDFAFGFISTHGGATDGGCLLAYDDDYLGQDFMEDLAKVPNDAALFFAIGACESESMFQGGWDWAERSGFAAMCPANVAFASACNWQESAWGMAGEYDEFETFLLKYGWQEGYADADGDRKLTIREAVQYAQEQVRGPSEIYPSHVVPQIPAALSGLVLGSAPQAPAAPLLQAPTGIGAAQGTDSEYVRIGWNAVPGATWYRVWRYSSSIGKSDLQCIHSWTPGPVFWDDCSTATTWKNLYFVEALGPNAVSAPSETAEGWLKSSFRDEMVAQGLASETDSLSEITEIGKTSTANGQTLYACYVAGIDPTDPNAAFKAKLVRDNGKWRAYPMDGEKEGRVYRVEGKKEMSDESWTDVTTVDDLEAAGWHFFRVGVELAE